VFVKGLIWARHGLVDGDDVLALHALCEFRSHPRVHFYGRAVLCLVQYAHSQVSRTGANFKNFIRRPEVCLNNQARAQSCAEGEGHR
jgi:hypothetical protein